MQARKCLHTYSVSGSSLCIWDVHVDVASSGLPVWLVKVDVEGSGPVCKHCLLCDETMVASTSASLMGDIHRALGCPQGFIVMIWHWGMGGGSKQEKRRKNREEQSMKRHESQSVREGCGEYCSMGIIMQWEGWRGEEEASHSGEEIEMGTKKNRKIRRICVHRCVHYTPSYSSDAHSHTELSGRFSHMRVTSIRPAFSVNIKMCQTVLCALVDSSENNIIPQYSSECYVGMWNSYGLYCTVLSCLLWQWNVL